jgi:hydroxymethylbilane synthase
VGVDNLTCRIGTRKSALARVQSEQIKDALTKQGISCELVLVESSGDKDRKTPLYEIESETPGLFTKQLETALLNGEVDIAVHSLKDLPTDQPQGLYVACIPFRVATHDCLVISPKSGSSHMPLNLKEGAVVGTSSLRREAQLLSKRPDVKVVPIRGNVPTRVQLVRDSKVDAVILADAGLTRLGLDVSDLIRIDLSADEFVPAPGQGALAIEARDSLSATVKQALAVMHDTNAELETRIERRVLKELHGGCTLPLGVRCSISTASPPVLKLRAFLGLSTMRDGGMGGEGNVRSWLSFHHFDIQESEEDTLVKKTVIFFKEVMA